MTASNLPGNVRTWTATQTASASVPSGVDGLDLRDVRGFRLIVTADTDQHIDGVGNMRAYVYDNSTAAWVAVPEWDKALSADAGGTFGMSWADVPVHARSGYLAYITDTVTVDSGNVNVRLVGYTGPA